MPELSHISSTGEARMVDVGEKDISIREAIARATLKMKPETLNKIKDASLKKGDALATARIAGIMAAKRTPDIIPLCHSILLNEVNIDFEEAGEDTLNIISRVKSTGKTGVEMEALVSVSVAALTIYDMVKAIDREMTITQTYLEMKSGGKNGNFKRTSK